MSAKDFAYAGSVVAAILAGMNILVRSLSWLRKKKDTFLGFWNEWKDVLAPLSVFATAILLAYMMHSLPYWYTKNSGVSSPIDFIKVQDDYRRTVLQTIGGVFALLALWYTARRVKVAEQSHITERFTKAIGQLGAVTPDNEPNIPIRLGAIYALERIAKDSPRDHWTILDILCAYFRFNAKAPDAPFSFVDIANNCNKDLRSDLQAVVDVLGRRPTRNKYLPYERRLNLGHCNIINARIERLHFDGFLLNHSNLCLSTIFRSTCLEALFWKTNFSCSNLLHSDFSYCDFAGTLFDDAKLVDSDFRGAKNLTVEQIFKAKEWQTCHFDPEFRAQLEAKLGKDEDTPTAAAAPDEPENPDS